MDRVSVVIPVYNAEKYLNRCIESVLNQTYSYLEIIIIDDGSKDNSKSICEHYASLDSRITVCSISNQGAGKARQIGVNMATGDKLCFLDSDDYWERDFIECMINVFNLHNADLVECAYYIDCENNKSLHQFIADDVVLDKQEFADLVVRNTIVDGEEAVVLWNKMYDRKNFVSVVNDFGDNFLEDYIINIQYYMSVDTYCYLAKPLTNYRMVKGSLSKRIQMDTIQRLNKEIVPLKKEALKCFKFSDEDISLAESNWYSNYIFNYLLQVITRKDCRTKIREIIKQIDDKEMELSRNKNRFSKLICCYPIQVVLGFLYLHGFVFGIKRTLYSLIHYRE